ncbi:MAG: invasin domain 3-containing protein [Candidatus Poribacteria bacterium]|nr:invasin domain 3-containing protein [Candidatus Poribacteria bacterium]
MVELKISPETKVVIDPSAKTDKDGKAELTFTTGKPEMKFIKASVDGIELPSSKAVMFSGDEINLEPVAEAETLTAVTAKNSLPADGESTTKLTITVLDKDGDALTDQQLEIEVENGTVGEVVNNNDGTYTATYIAGTKAGEVVITAKTSNGKSATATITLTEKVDQPTTEATFAVSTLKAEQSGSAGEFVSYLVKLEGKDGFADKVTLFATDPPEGIKIEFDPKEVTLSAEDALKTSQMALTLDKNVAAKDYAITALATSDSGSIQKLIVTVKVESADLAATAILLTVKPKDLQLSQSLEVFGQLANISEGDISIPANSVITLTFTSPAGETTEFKVNTVDDGDYQLATPYTPNEVGEWQISANFPGTNTFKSSSKSSKFKVAKGSAVIAFDNADSALLGTNLELVGNLKPKLADQKVSIKIIKPDGSVPTPIEIKTEDLGIFKQSISLDASGAWEITAIWDGNDDYDSVTKTLSVDVSAEVGKAIIVLGGGNAEVNSEWKIFSSVADYVYDVFIKRQFDADEDIHFLSPSLSDIEGADTLTALETLEKAITDWAKKQVNNQVPLYIYLLSHNLGDKFLLEKTDTKEKYLSPQLLDTWLDMLPEGTPVTVVIEACYSGNFIAQDGIKSVLVDKDRTIIVSASSDKQAKIARSSSFSRTFFSLIESNQTISNAFDQAAQKMERMVYHRDQFPQIESSGDGNPNQREDYLKLEETYLPANMISLAAPPNITTITQPTELKKGISSQRIEVELIGADVSRVYATVIPPSFDPKAEISSWEDLAFDEFDLGKVSDGKYAVTYANFTVPGAYSVVINAENSDGFADPIQTTITVAGEVSQPEPQKLTGDVNGDGTVNIFDLVIAAGSFGKTGTDIMGDVNGDGGVNIFDLVIVAGNFGQSLAACCTFYDF